MSGSKTALRLRFKSCRSEQSWDEMHTHLSSDPNTWLKQTMLRRFTGNISNRKFQKVFECVPLEDIIKALEIFNEQSKARSPHCIITLEEWQQINTSLYQNLHGAIETKFHLNDLPSGWI